MTASIFAGDAFYSSGSCSADDLFRLIALIFQRDIWINPQFSFGRPRRNIYHGFSLGFTPLLRWPLALTHWQIPCSPFLFPLPLQDRQARCKQPFKWNATTHRLLIVIPTVSILRSCFTRLGMRIRGSTVNQKWDQGRPDSRKWMCASSLEPRRFLQLPVQGNFCP